MKSDEWDKQERKKFPSIKYTMKQGQLKEVFADMYGFRYLIHTIGDRIPLEELREVCDQSVKLFDIPESPDDSKQIAEFIFREMQNRGWEL